MREVLDAIDVADVHLVGLQIGQPHLIGILRRKIARQHDFRRQGAEAPATRDPFRNLLAMVRRMGIDCIVLMSPRRPAPDLHAAIAHPYPVPVLDDHHLPWENSMAEHSTGLLIGPRRLRR